MFSIEHEFDATVITLVDEDPAPLQEDVVINSFAECITIEQFDARTNQMMKITLSRAQHIMCCQSILRMEWKKS